MKEVIVPDTPLLGKTASLLGGIGDRDINDLYIRLDHIDNRHEQPSN